MTQVGSTTQNEGIARNSELRLQVELPRSVGGRMRFRNPLMSAAAGLGNIVEFRDYVDFRQVAALLPNSLMEDDGTPADQQRIYPDDAGFFTRFGKNNISLQRFIDEVLPQLPAEDTPILASLKAASAEEMCRSAALVARTPGLAGAEINLICPYGAPGPQVTADYASFAVFVRDLRRAMGGKLLLFKLPGGAPEPLIEVARICAAEGADALTTFNAESGLAVDVRQRSLQRGGFVGPAVKATAMARFHLLANAVDIPLIAAGGVDNARNILEYVMLGAYLVQAGSANFRRPDFLTAVLPELLQLMDELGIATLAEVRGVVR